MNKRVDVTVLNGFTSLATLLRLENLCRIQHNEMSTEFMMQGIIYGSYNMKMVENIVKGIIGHTLWR